MAMTRAQELEAAIRNVLQVIQSAPYGEAEEETVRLLEAAIKVPDEYPAPWRYCGEENWISRDTNPEGDGEIAMHFTHDGMPDDRIMAVVLKALNKADLP